MASISTINPGLKMSRISSITSSNSSSNSSSVSNSSFVSKDIYCLGRIYLYVYAFINEPLGISYGFQPSSGHISLKNPINPISFEWI